MLSLWKNSILRRAVILRMSSLAATVPSSSTAPQIMEPSKMFNSNEDRFVDEKVLLKKYGREMLNSNWNTLHEAAEYFEWNRFLKPSHLLRINELVARDGLKATELTDRQLAQLLSAFGNKAFTASKKFRVEEMGKLMKKMAEEDIKFGPLSLTAILESKLDNNEPVNVLEELQKWEINGFEITPEFLVLLAKAYASEGNVTGASELIHYAKEEKFDVIPELVVSLVRSLATNGKYAEAESAIQEAAGLGDKMVARLRLNVCEVAAMRREMEVFWQQISLISIDKMTPFPRLHRRIIIRLIENQQWDEVEKLRSLFTQMVQKNKSGLSKPALENPLITTKIGGSIWAYLNEGRVDCALVAYSFANYPEPLKKKSLLAAVARRLQNSLNKVEEAIELAKLAVKCGIENSLADVLHQACDDKMKPRRLFELMQVLPADEFGALLDSPEKRLAIAKKLVYIRDLKSNEERVALTERIARILLPFPDRELRSHVEEAHSIICNAFGADLEIAKMVLDKFSTEPVLHRGLATAIIDAFLRLRQLDPSMDDKTLELITSDKIRRLELFHLSPILLRLLQTKSDDSNKLLSLVAQIIALSFPEDTRDSSIKEAKIFADLIRPRFVAPNTVDELVDQILTAKEGRRVGLGEVEIKHLASRFDGNENDLKKLEYLQRLNRKGQTAFRWRNSTIEQLEKELDHLIEKQASNKILDDLRVAIIKKASITQDIVTGSRHCLALLEAKRTSRRAIDEVKLFKGKALAYALKNNMVDEALGLFELNVQTEPLAALSLIALLHLASRVEEADKIVKRVKEQKVAFDNPNLYERLGNTLTSVEPAQIEALATYLKDALGVNAAFTRRLYTKKVLSDINQLIEEGKLAEAFSLSVNESAKCSFAIGRIELAKAAVANADPELLKDIISLIGRYHTKSSAYVDAGYALLFGGQREPAEQMLMLGGKVTDKKVHFFVMDANVNRRNDVLRDLFEIWARNDLASKVDLNFMLTHLCSAYYRDKDAASILSLRQLCREISFPLEKETLEKFHLIKNLATRGKEATAEKETPV